MNQTTIDASTNKLQQKRRSSITSNFALEFSHNLNSPINTHEFTQSSLCLSINNISKEFTIGGRLFHPDIVIRPEERILFYKLKWAMLS